MNHASLLARSVSASGTHAKGSRELFRFIRNRQLCEGTGATHSQIAPILWNWTSPHNQADNCVRHVPICRRLHLSRIVEQPRARPFIPTPEERERILRNARNPKVTGEEGREEAYLKAHPYRNLITWKSKSELAQLLIDNVIYNENGLFVTNKPFGVGVRNPPPHRVLVDYSQIHLRGIVTSPYTLEDVIPELRARLGEPELVLAKSTEKLTSGLAVFAKDEATGKRFSSALKSSKGHYDTQYKYNVVTILPPAGLDPHKVERLGVQIKVGAEKEIGQPVLLREYSANAVKRREVVAVHVQTKLLNAGANGGFLLEINTSSVVHNFLRIFCADKLAPILGDHLYSCRVQSLRGIPVKIDPTHLVPGSSQQKLPANILDILELKRPEDTLIVPAHVHLRSYKIRKFLGMGMEMEFEAPYPPHFKWTSAQLGIILDDGRP